MNNILVLSCGTRNKIIRYFKENLKYGGKVFATDCSKLAPALYEADKFFIVPRMTENGYIEKILKICEEEKVSGVLSLIDPELSLLAENKERFENIGVTIIGSDIEKCDLSLNKWKMYNWLKENGYKCAKTYVDIEEFKKDFNKKDIDFPVFVKPIEGSASISISKICDMKTLELVFGNGENLLIQEFLDGQEIGVDCYIDMLSNELVSIFSKNKVIMRAGETDKATSIKDDKLFELVKKFVKDVGYKGVIDIDIFKINDVYYISEVNPRFGGGYPFAYEANVNFMEKILKNLQGEKNKVELGNYSEGISMAKYCEIKMVGEDR